MNAGNAERTITTREHEQPTRDPRLDALRSALVRLRHDVDAYGAPLTDRAVAERELATLEAAAATGEPAGPVLRHGLLLLAAAVGSVRVLAPALAELRLAIDLFGTPHRPVPVGPNDALN